MRKTITKVLCGSHLQGLDTENSDEDWKLLVLPTPMDLIDGRQKAHCETDENGNDYDIHDIRDLPDLLWKANPTYLEILFSDKEEKLPDYDLGLTSRLAFMTLRLAREPIARMNLPYLWNASWGMHYNRLKRMYRDVGPNGYNGKNACHSIRGLTMLIKYAENGFTDFASCLRLDDTTRANLIAIKKGEVPLNVVQGSIQKAEDDANRYRDQYLNATPDKELYDQIREAVRRAVWIDVKASEWEE